MLRFYSRRALKTRAFGFEDLRSRSDKSFVSVKSHIRRLQALVGSSSRQSGQFLVQHGSEFFSTLNPRSEKIVVCNVVGKVSLS